MNIKFECLLKNHLLLDGDLGPVYGHQWTFNVYIVPEENYDGKVDQLKEITIHEKILLLEHLEE